MSRRRLTIKRIDPWSVLKVGAVVNVCIWLIVLIGFGVLWFFVLQLGLVDRACDIASRTGTVDECSISGAGIFRSLVILGLIGAIIQTGLFVVAAFLYNTISQMIGGLQFITEDGASSPAVEPARARKQGERPSERTPEQPAAAAAAAGTGGDSEGTKGDTEPASEMRQRAKELAARRRAEAADEARRLQQLRQAQRERASRTEGQSTPPIQPPIKRRPDA